MDAIHGTITTGGVAEVHDLDRDYDVVRIDNDEPSGNGGTPLFATVGSTVTNDPPVPEILGPKTLEIHPGSFRVVRVLGAGRTRVRLIAQAKISFSIYGYTVDEYRPG